MELSERLTKIIQMVSPGMRVADVGCDHGFVSIRLYEKGISPKVFAMDLRERPLLRAKAHIAEKGYEAYIETRLSDGVSALLPGEADAMVCAGMGGRLIAKILLEGMDKVRPMQELILGPQSELSYFRRFLRENGFRILDEEMVKEDGKYYPLLKAKWEGDFRQQDSPFKPEWEDAYGPALLRKAHPILRDFLQNRCRMIQNILDNMPESGANGRAEELTEEKEGILACLQAMEKAGEEK